MYQWIFEAPCFFCGKPVRRIYRRRYLPGLGKLICKSCQEKHPEYWKNASYQKYLSDLNHESKRKKFLIKKEKIEIKKDLPPRSRKLIFNPALYFIESELKIGTKVFRKLNGKKIFIGKIVKILQGRILIQKFLWDMPLQVNLEKIELK